MADFPKNDLQHLLAMLSPARLAPYLAECGGDRAQALMLYRWNLTVSAALLIPVHITEVMLRNAIIEAISRAYGDKWPWSEAFIQSLPNLDSKSDNNARNPRGLLQLAIDKSGGGRNVERVVSQLGLYFWEQMLTHRHDRRIWVYHFNAVFPNAPLGQGMPKNRNALQERVRKMRNLRNRIAHHEPIFPRNLDIDLIGMDAIVRWRSAVAADWMGQLHDLNALIVARPPRG